MARFHDRMFEMCIDQETWNSFMGDEVSWSRPYKCDGIDPSIFPKGELPMKKIFLDENMELMENYPVTAMYYAMTHGRSHVKGPPVGLLRVTLGDVGLSRSFLNGSLVPHIEQHGVVFTKSVTPENYDIQNGQALLPCGAKRREAGVCLLHAYRIVCSTACS